MTEQFTLANVLRFATFLSLLGVAVLLYQLPQKIGQQSPLACGSSYNPCKMEAVELSEYTLRELQTRLKTDIPSIPRPCGERFTPCFVIVDK